MSNKGKYFSKRSYAVLQPGQHLVEVKSCQIVLAKNNLQTPQHATVVKSLDPETPGTITIFTNDQGYEHNKDGSVKFDPKTNEPIISEENTAIARAIFGDLANCAGVPEGDYDLADLEGLKLGIVVKEVATKRGTSMRVVKWTAYDDMVRSIELTKQLEAEEAE